MTTLYYIHILLLRRFFSVFLCALRWVLDLIVVFTLFQVHALRSSARPHSRGCLFRSAIWYLKNPSLCPSCLRPTAYLLTAYVFLSHQPLSLYRSVKKVSPPLYGERTPIRTAGKQWSKLSSLAWLHNRCQWTRASAWLGHSFSSGNSASIGRGSEEGGRAGAYPFGPTRPVFPNSRMSQLLQRPVYAVQADGRQYLSLATMIMAISASKRCQSPTPLIRPASWLCAFVPCSFAPTTL